MWETKAPRFVVFVVRENRLHSSLPRKYQKTSITENKKIHIDALGLKDWEYYNSIRKYLNW